MKGFGFQLSCLHCWVVGLCVASILNICALYIVYQNQYSYHPIPPSSEKTYTLVEVFKSLHDDKDESILQHPSKLLVPENNPPRTFTSKAYQVKTNKIATVLNRQTTTPYRREELKLTTLKPAYSSLPRTTRKSASLSPSGSRQNITQFNRRITTTKAPTRPTTKPTPSIPPEPIPEDIKEEEVKNMSWSDCLRLVNQSKRLLESKRKFPLTAFQREDQHIIEKYTNSSFNISQQWLKAIHSSTEEEQFPIAFGILVYKGAQLFERLLRAIYSPYNVYCIHIDFKTGEVFRQAVRKIIEHLPNVFIAQKSVNVIYFHASTIQAQINCMEELLLSPIKWKYFLNLCAQDFPLYSNLGLVRALKSLNGANNIQSYLPDGENRKRTSFVHIFTRTKGVAHMQFALTMTKKEKEAPPFNITIYKGSSMAALTREFCQFAVHNETAHEFLNWLNDTAAPDETFFASLHRHPGVPGGIVGKQPKWITRSLRWQYDPPHICYGAWVRSVCVLAIGDMTWIFSGKMSAKLFAQKIPFNFRLDMITCFDKARRNRDVYRSNYF